MAGNTEITYEIKEHIGVINTNENGWNKELNVVSWNGGPEKIDIRDWDPSHERMSRGITLTEEQAEKAAMLLGRRYRERAPQSVNAPARDDMAR